MAQEVFPDDFCKLVAKHVKCCPWRQWGELYCYQIEALVAKKSDWLAWDVTDVCLPKYRNVQTLSLGCFPDRKCDIRIRILCQVIVLNHKTHQTQAVSPFELHF